MTSLGDSLGQPIESVLTEESVTLSSQGQLRRAEFKLRSVCSYSASPGTSCSNKNHPECCTATDTSSGVFLVENGCFPDAVCVISTCFRLCSS